MAEHHFYITLDCPIGLRKGMLDLREQNGSCEGMLTLLTKALPCAGTVDEAGRLSLHGTLETLRTTQPYTAEGTMTAAGLTMTLHAGQHRYPLYGTRR